MEIIWIGISKEEKGIFVCGEITSDSYRANESVFYRNQTAHAGQSSQKIAKVLDSYLRTSASNP